MRTAFLIPSRSSPASVLSVFLLARVHAVSLVSSLRLASLAHLSPAVSPWIVFSSLFSFPLSLSLSLTLSLFVDTRGSLGLLRAFITGHYFSGMLLTVTLRNDKLICSRSGRGGKVYRANEGSAHVLIDGESYGVCGKKMQSREGSILPG